MGSRVVQLRWHLREPSSCSVSRSTPPWISYIRICLGRNIRRHCRLNFRICYKSVHYASTASLWRLDERCCVRILWSCVYVGCLREYQSCVNNVCWPSIVFHIGTPNRRPCCVSLLLRCRQPLWSLWNCLYELTQTQKVPSTDTLESRWD